MCPLRNARVDDAEISRHIPARSGAAKVADGLRGLGQVPRTALKAARAYVPAATIALLSAGNTGTLAICFVWPAVLPWIAAGPVVSTVVARTLASVACIGAVGA